MPKMTIKVVFCWSDISGYMAACWRALHQLPDIDVFIVAFQARTETAFSDQLMQGIPCRLLDLKERQDTSLIEHLVTENCPDIVVLCGWFHQPYRQLAFASQLQRVTLVMTMDTPWWGTWKQYLTRWVLHSYLKQIDWVVVPGERSWQYARRLGFTSARIIRGLYGIDYGALAPLWQERCQQPWPKSFLFVGRYRHDKGLDVLVEAYRYYRAQIEDPWPLVCCGQGSLEHLLQQPGIDNRGFVQPVDMRDMWRNTGVFLLPSRFDPWPLALAEAAAAGLPVICTDACGSAVELIRSQYNGLMIPSEEPEALAQALLTTHKCYDSLLSWGQRSQQLAAPYATEIWAIRWQQLCYQASQIQKNGKNTNS